MDAVDIREVGPRDGLQAEAPASVDDRVRLIEALLEAGVRHVEACSFVSPKAVPSMAGAVEVMARVPRAPEYRYAALVPNLKGAEMALDAGVDELTVTVSASETYNKRNVRMSIEQSLDEIKRICALARTVPVDAVISCSFGSPYEGRIDASDVVLLANRLQGVGASRITYADTTGMATPPLIETLVHTAGTVEGLHLHDSRGTALVNAYAALEHGVRRFDSSIGGLGGSPFADGAAGNLATEELVYLLDDVGYRTGIGLGPLLRASALAAEIIGHPVASRLAMAGPRKGSAA
ncbi:MAG: hydroxymethylglutaryl-CoA lyase [Acidimicrobiia bacterium]|nr:hydroxymethylglutaryl-CoA lyase [Acidimicrobiia bacterium]